MHSYKGHGNWGSWSSYSACSKTCEAGTKTRTQDCDNPAPFGDPMGNYCDGGIPWEPKTGTKNCNKGTCPSELKAILLHEPRCFYLFYVI